MCRMQCLLAFVAFSMYFVSAWDIAINTEDEIKFYTNKSDILVHYRDLSALAYDTVNKTMFFVAKEDDHASIVSYNLDTKQYQTLVGDKLHKNIQGIAYDPVENLLFWIDFDKKSIFRKSLKPGDNQHRLLFTMDHELPNTITVDSCRGYIYWTNTNITKPTIERARFDGSERKVIIKNDIYRAYSIAVDQQTKKLYWIDKREGIHYSIESSDLDGKNRKQLLYNTHQTPNALAISKDSIFWVDLEQRTVWKLSKIKPKLQPEAFVEFGSEKVFGIVANYGIEDQTKGVAECAVLAKLSQSTPANTSAAVPLPVNVELKNVQESSRNCLEKPCEISVCLNYCFQGDCSVTPEGKPQCSCEHGFTGVRCEINVCHGYCLNDGKCSLDKEDKPVCSCTSEYDGKRCERATAVNTTKDTGNGHCNCSNDTILKASSAFTEDEIAFSSKVCGGEWDPIRDPIIVSLGCLCGILCVACAVLFTKVLELKKRPRIKKRIIVNKNLTPLTARPDQCEITIENCCNMNICETPCFEPRTTIRPTLLDAKPGKEEKKNLISNMEHPDDLY